MHLDRESKYFVDELPDWQRFSKPIRAPNVRYHPEFAG
jgi:hypothetical protein